MIDRMLALVVATSLSLVVGAGGYVTYQIPAFNDVVHPCLAREADQPPAQRMETCTCLAKVMMTPTATAIAMVTTSSAGEMTYRANLNACRAHAFDRSVGTVAETRMSPMRRLSEAPVRKTAAER
ncbi:MULTISPECIES: hypothetical protein [Hyphomicrobiales]|uniref:DUF2946 domain-containing protein n=1 Tax=Bosea massiliensis TaxID=151419 RepID=A0ABW0PAE1_9HYPH|nr:hypothetical protein [Bradyrhizobium sp. CCH5-A9]